MSKGAVTFYPAAVRRWSASLRLVPSLCSQQAGRDCSAGKQQLAGLGTLRVAGIPGSLRSLC